MKDILTPQELQALTGAKLARAQARVLKASGIHYHIDARRRVVTTWTWVDRAPRTGETPTTDEEPNYGAATNG